MGSSGPKKRYQKAGHLDFHKIFTYKDGELLWAEKVSDKVVVGKPAGWLKGNGYKHVSVKNIQLPVHHIVWKMFNGEFVDEGLEIDHINGIRADNRIENLRAVTRTNNSMNKGGYGRTTPYRGVYKLPSGKFCVRFKREYLGSYETVEEAAKVWNKRALEYSPCAKLNEA